MNVRAGFVKTKPTSHAKVLGQPIFSNPLITNVASTKAGCTRVKDLWDRENREWMNLSTFGINFHVIN